MVFYLAILRSMYISRGSSFSRTGLLAYLLAIAYASLYPFSGWRDISGPPYAYLFAPLSRYWTWFDVITNVLAYMPLGLLVVFALHPVVKGKTAVFLAIVTGTLLSGTLESVQTYLPSRVPSSLDLFTNFLGSCFGAFLGLKLVPTFLDQGLVHRLGQRWFRREAHGILIVLALWPLSQIYPQSFLFGHGHLISEISAWFSVLMEERIDLGESLRHLLHLDFAQPSQFWLSETIITACGLTGTMMTLLCLLRKTAPRLMLCAALLLCALSTKSLAIALFFGPDNGFAWFTPGAFGGLIIGIMMVYGLNFSPATVQRHMAILALSLCFLVVNLVPPNHYFVATLSAWSHGKFLNFNGAAYMLALCWPILALSFLLLLEHQGHQED